MDKNNSEELREMDEYAQDLRHLIVMDTQYGWNGETTLKLPEIERLVTRGWVAEGSENNEYEITDTGRSLIESTLTTPAAGDCLATAGFVLVPREPTEVWAAAVTKALSLHNAGYGSAVIREVLAAAPAAEVAELTKAIAAEQYRIGMGYHETNAESVARVVLRHLSNEPAAEAQAPGTDAMRVIDPEQWEPCSPESLAAGTDCATAPRVWNATGGNHWHPKPCAPAVVGDESEDSLVMRLDELLAAQGRLMFARDRYDEDKATNFGVSLLDFMRLHGTELRRRAGLAAAGDVETPKSLRDRADRLEREQHESDYQRLVSALRGLVATGASEAELSEWFSTGLPYRLFGSHGDLMQWSATETAQYFIGSENTK